jgi:hypothetical protein
MEQRISPFEFSVEELDRELMARGAQIPEKKRFKFSDREGTPERDAIMAHVKKLYNKTLTLNNALSHISTWELTKIIMFKIGKMAIDDVRGSWGPDGRMDSCMIEDDTIRSNTNCVAAICLKDNLINKNETFSILNVKNFGETFNLCDNEPFRDQPISAGHLCTGFLVKEDVIATAAHFTRNHNVTDLRIIFGFKMKDESTPEIRFHNENIYKGINVIHSVYSGLPDGPDWALVKLDHKVKDQVVAMLSKDEIYSDQEIYVMGHPCGLPLKYAPGAYVCDFNETCFAADLDIYSGNSGSPVFDNKTHEVIGMVTQGDNRDFRWTDRGLISVRYPNLKFSSKGAHCTRVSEFIEYC